MSVRGRQLAAVGAIVTALAALVAAGVLFWNEWSALLLAVAFLVVATLAAWYALSRRGVTRLVAAVVMLGALVGALLALVRDHSLWRIALVLLLGLGAAALARVALGAGRSELRAQAPPGARMGSAVRPVLIANPKSGGGKANDAFQAEARDAKMGTAAKMLPDLLGTDYSQFDFEIEGPTGVDRANPELIFVSNNVYQLACVGGFGTRERLDEGVLGIIAIDVDNVSDLAQLVALETAGRGSSFSGWHEWSDTELVLRSSKPVDAGIDGEAVTLEPPVRFEVRPGALRVRIAPHHPGVSPAAVVGTVRRGGLRRLLSLAAGRDRRQSADPVTAVTKSPGARSLRSATTPAETHAEHEFG